MPIFEDPLKQKYKIDCDDLKKIFNEFNAITGQNLKEIERLLEQVRNGEKDFSHKHLGNIQDEKYWSGKFPFEPFPSLNENEKKISAIAKAIKNRNEREACIRTLYSILGRIEHVSLILRFVDPDDFALFSPHSMIILGTKRTRDIVNTYVNYLKDLEEIKEKSKGEFPRIADIDHTIYLLSILDGNPDLKPKTEPKTPLSKIYEMKNDLLGRIDSLIMKIKVINLLGDSWEKDPTTVARSFLGKNNSIASVLAGDILKERIRQICKYLDVKEYDEGKNRYKYFDEKVDEFEREGHITTEEADNFKVAWGFRTDIIAIFAGNKFYPPENELEKMASELIKAAEKASDKLKEIKDSSGKRQ
ncbi:MAG TPA: hypothetical protein ACFYD6_09810 [Candidatus Brocadiia bacterium]|nr:hypothetical protein [Candidatus Brocadiales bacterium]